MQQLYALHTTGLTSVGLSGSDSEKNFISLCDLLSGCGVPITKVVFDDLG